MRKDTVCAKSDFFSAACKKEWLGEEKEKTIPVPEVLPDIFTLYAHWAYSGEVDLTILDDDRQAEEAAGLGDGYKSMSSKRRYLKQNRLVKLHIAADFLGDVPLKKQTIDLLTGTIGSVGLILNASHLNSIWEHTSHESGLRLLYLDYFIFKPVERLNLAKNKDELDPDLFFDPAMRQLSPLVGKTTARDRLRRSESYYDTPDP